jgi:hypothetical protein
MKALTILLTVSGGEMLRAHYGLLDMMATLRFED